MTANIGAYPVFTFIPDLTLFMGVGVYKVADVDLQSTCVFTNTTTVAAYRGAGRPEAAYYLERLVDIVAAELGKHPEDVRRKNNYEGFTCNNDFLSRVSDVATKGRMATPGGGTVPSPANSTYATQTASGLEKAIGSMVPSAYSEKDIDQLVQVITDQIMAKA